MQMGEEADHFRSRAEQCRELAKTARAKEDRETLSQMAEDLDAEAARIDAEDAPNTDEA